MKDMLFPIIIGIIMFTIAPWASGQNQLDTLNFKLIAKGVTSEPYNFHVVCYNRYFNEENFSKEFLQQNNLTKDLFKKKKMLIEIFNRNHNDSTSNILDIDQIILTNSTIDIYYTSSVDSDKALQGSSYIILQTDRIKKPVKFFKNGELIGRSTTKLYMD